MSMSSKIQKLLFVYNAHSGKLNAVLDAGHKLLSPSTYQCSLCSLTYGAFSEKKEWKSFREKADVPMEFLHIDDFEAQYASKFRAKFNYPIVLAEADGDLQVIMSSEKLNSLENVEMLIEGLSKLTK